MAGVTAAWELSRPGWRDRVESVTVYQRGWVLGGKGASTRDAQGRIFEHGLHVWPGYYDNAFRVVRECYSELDRVRTDPECPIRTWRDAFTPAPAIGVFEHVGDDVVPWLAQFRCNDRTPGDPHRRADDLNDLVRRLLGLAADLAQSARGRVGPRMQTGIDLVSTVARGITADGLLREPGGFARVDDEDFRSWLRRHGASRATVEGGIVRAMYDLVFGYRAGDKTRPEFAAGLGVFLAIRMFLDYQGSLFWKMTAGMGDVVFAPFQQALRARGVRVRYGHGVDELVPSPDGRSLERVRMTRDEQGHDLDGFDPLVRVGGIPCFPDTPPWRPHETTDEVVTLRHGEDFDVVILAISLGAVPEVAAAIVRHHPRWQAMIREVGTVRTQAAQVWFSPSEAELGWAHPGATFAGLDAELDTCASMSHLIAHEGWSTVDDAPPRSLAYLCSVVADGDTTPTVARTLAEFMPRWSTTLWPGAAPIDVAGPEVRSVMTRLNDDPSDRYVQALPGSDRYRMRVDESGIDHLVLAGDWTDCGLNAGCIEAAAISGIEAAAAVEGRPLVDRVLGPLTWDWL